MDIELKDFLYNQAISYLGRYPSTKKKLKIHLKKKLKSKRYFSKIKFNEDIDIEDVLDSVLNRIEHLKILNESNYMESLFNHFTRSLFSIHKMNQKFYNHGFELKEIEKFLDEKFFEDSELELKILRKYVIKKKIQIQDKFLFKKKVYSQGFKEDTISKYLKE